MSLKIETNENYFIYNKIKYPIIETFIDFINSFSADKLQEMKSILLKLDETRNTEYYYKTLNNNKYSIFYYPILQIPQNLVNEFNSSNSLSKYAKQWLHDSIAYLSAVNIYNIVNTISLFFNPTSKYVDLTVKQKYALFLKSNFCINQYSSTITYTDIKYKSNINFTNNIDTNYKLIKSQSEPELITYIEFEDIESMCQYAILKMLKDNVSIKNCKNCNRLFIADNKREYCNRINENGLTCYQISSSNIFKEKKNSDPYLQEYMRAYKRLQNFYYKNSFKITNELKQKLFQEIKTIYDNTKINNVDLEKYKHELSTYNYDNLTKKYL